MNTRAVFVVGIATLVAGLALCGAQLPPAPAAVGFGVSVPPRLPVDWTASFSYLSLESLLTPNLTAIVELGTYPSDFPDLYEGSGALLVKGWLGPTAIYAGGGLTVQWRRVGAAWSIRPLVNLRVGTQTWILDSLALVLQVRSLQSLPISWAFSPEISLGLTMGLGQARPEIPRFDGDVLWLLVGLGVAALIAFLPRI